MNDKLIEAMKNLEIHADVLMKIPSNEQHIGNIQSVVSIAILDIKRAIEAAALEPSPPQGKEAELSPFEKEREAARMWIAAAEREGIDITGLDGPTWVEKAIDAEQARWQQRLDDQISKAYPDRDGGGCESGDPLDLTDAELRQAFNHLTEPVDVSNRSLFRPGTDEQIDKVLDAAAQAEIEQQFIDGIEKRAKTELLSADVLGLLGIIKRRLAPTPIPTNASPSPPPAAGVLTEEERTAVEEYRVCFPDSMAVQELISYLDRIAPRLAPPSSAETTEG